MSFGKQLTVSQIQNRRRKSRSATRGKMQNHHTPPTVHTEVDKPGFIPMKGIPRLRDLLTEPTLANLTLQGKKGKKVLAIQNCRR